MRPLYEINKKIDWDNSKGNAGLWYDKFCDKWSENWTFEDSAKFNWIQTVAKKVGNDVQLEALKNRLISLVQSKGQAPLFFKTNSTFVTGLGREHPVENGFAWHQSLGVPFLPGSSVKGLVRAYATSWLQEDKVLINHIFGPLQSDGASTEPQVGSVIFLDALPTKAVQLKADIITPHYAPYYQDDSNTIPPADWHDPTPIPFLVVDKQQSFMFSIMPRTQDAQEDCEQVKIWLQEALEYIGAGAKTATGYGRFSIDEHESGKLEKQRKSIQEQAKKDRQEQLRLTELSDKSPLYIEFDKLIRDENLFDDGDAFNRNLDVWLPKVENNPDPEVAQLLSELARKHLPKAFDGSSKKERQLNIAERIIKLENE